MIELQKTFNENYMKSLRDAVKSGRAIPLYSNNSFEIDQSQVKHLANVYAPKYLVERLVPTQEGDYESAIAIFEAYKDISPLLASNECFWTYITHTELFNYVQKRWNKVLSGKATSDYILDHWFMGDNGLSRNAVASLWWSVYCSIDKQRNDKYELTKVLFQNFTFRVITFGFSLLMRHNEAMIGILEFIKDTPEIMNGSFESRGRFISKYFNRLGAERQLSYLKRDFFYNTCLHLKERIISIHTRDDLKNEELYDEII